MIPSKITFNYLLLVFILVIVACSKENSMNNSSFVENQFLDRKYDEVCFLSTHNAMNNKAKGFIAPNQTFSITQQLNDGVRCLMLDTYDGNNGIALTYHVLPQLGSQKLVDAMQEIKNFLTQHQKEIITIIFQNDGSNVQLEKAIDSIGLNTMTYIHTNNTPFPTMQTMVDNNQRLVLFVESDKRPRASYLMHAWKTIFDTKYTYSNVNQFDSNVNRGGSGSKELYLINHWLGGALGLPDSTLAPKANTRAVVSKRAQDCATANNHFINFFGVDFYHIGDAKAVVDSINGL